MITIHHEQQATTLDAGQVRNGDLWLSPGDAERATGWQLKPEGLCQGDVCVPIPAGRRSDFANDGRVNISGFWRHMGHPVVSDSAGTAFVFGTAAADRASQLEGLQAPDFALADLNGAVTALSAHRGQKVMLATWASW